MILHLEDESPLREILKVSLTAFQPGLVIHQFASADDAVFFLKDHLSEIRVFVLDIRVIGSMDGLQVAEKIRQMGSTRPIVLTSAYRKPNKEWMERLKCIWLEKPWHILDAHKTILPLIKG
jgi:CheY-like chemotaxis protein